MKQIELDKRPLDPPMNINFVEHRQFSSLWQAFEVRCI